MSKENLTPEQQKAAKLLDKTIERLSNIADELKDYKLGDVYILEEWARDNPKTVWVEKTHMGFPVKYKVVYISPQGIPHFRKLTSSGNPTGEAFLPPQAAILQHLMRMGQANVMGMIDDVTTQRFVPDPEQLDSILLQTEFDPMELHREKSKLFNEINKHNKSVAIPTGYYAGNSIATFFKSLKAGDKFWTAPDKQYVIQSVLKQGREYEVTATDMNQATVTFCFEDFRHKRLYRDKPRSFKQESAL